MDNQHKHIKGYRDLSQEEIDMMNEIKGIAAQAGEMVEQMKKVEGLDQRWIAIGATNLQQGFMAITRGVAQPTNF